MNVSFIYNPNSCRGIGQLAVTRAVSDNVTVLIERRDHHAIWVEPCSHASQSVGNMVFLLFKINMEVYKDVRF